MEYVINILFGAAFVYILIIITIIIFFLGLYLYVKIKVRNKSKRSFNKIYKYKNYNMKLVRNTLGVKKAIYFLLKQDFRKAIEQENELLGFEYVKPFDFTKLREQDVQASDLMGAIVIICEKKDLLPQIFKLFIKESDKYKIDFDKDYAILSEMAIDILSDFFFENLWKMH